MNGSRLMEGYVPDVDATVVSRILDAGGRIIGKSVCENLCFDSASFTSATGPVVNPYDKNRMALGSSSGSAALVRNNSVYLIPIKTNSNTFFLLSLVVVVVVVFVVLLISTSSNHFTLIITRKIVMINASFSRFKQLEASLKNTG